MYHVCYFVGLDKGGHTKYVIGSTTSPHPPNDLEDIKKFQKQIENFYTNQPSLHGINVVVGIISWQKFGE